VKHAYLQAHCHPTLIGVAKAATLDGQNMEAALQRSHEECNNLEQAWVDQQALLRRARDIVELWVAVRRQVALAECTPATVRARASKDAEEAEELLHQLNIELRTEN
jgi:hypothetical protein